MLARAHGFDRPFRVQRDRKRDVHGIDVVLGDHVVVAAVGARDVVGFRVSLGSGEGARANGDDDDFRMRLGAVVEADGSEGGGSEDAEADRAGRLLDGEVVEFVVPVVESEKELLKVRKSRSRKGEYVGSESAELDDIRNIPYSGRP